MPRVFLYEQITALGLGESPYSPLHSLYLEGRLMRDAVAGDFRLVPGVELDCFQPGELEERFDFAVQTADWTILIAPETGGELFRLAKRVEQLGGNLLGPSSTAVELTSDKLALAKHWQTCGVRTPRVLNSEERTFPCVVKPRDGAGSNATFLIRDEADWKNAKDQFPSNAIVQPFISGIAASVAFVIGNSAVPLVPTRQIQSDDGHFHYLGGELPIEPELAVRAIQIGLRAVECVPGLFGYVGVDLILGNSATHDSVIEINPRLTTSYIGLRRLAKTNLASAMLAIAAGSPHSLFWGAEPIQFSV